MRKVHNIDQKTIEEGLGMDSIPTHLFNDIELEELVDIRENSAYVAFVQLIGGYINYEEEGYEILAKEYKREIKYAAGNLIKIQLRELVDKSFKEYVNFFTSFPKLEDFDDSFKEEEVLVKGITRRSTFLRRTEEGAGRSFKKPSFDSMINLKKHESQSNYKSSKFINQYSLFLL